MTIHKKIGNHLKKLQETKREKKMLLHIIKTDIVLTFD